MSRSRTVPGIAIAIALFGQVACSDPPGIHEDSVASFRDGGLAEFEAENGDVGAFALPIMAALASKDLVAPYADVEAVFLADPVDRELVDGVDVELGEGAYALTVRDADGQQFFGSLELENTGTGPAVILLEAFAEDGNSLGFGYVKLGPGDRYVYQHNLLPLIVFITAKEGIGLLAGAVVLVGAGTAISAGVEEIIPVPQCKVLKNTIRANVCKGGCTTGTCQATSTDSFWGVGTEPSACACQ